MAAAIRNLKRSVTADPTNHYAYHYLAPLHVQTGDLAAYQRGGVDYISVPVIPELLRAKVSVFAELYRKNVQLERLNMELRRLSSRLLTAQDEERRRFARDLHDGVGQDLAAAKMMLDGMIFRPTTNSNGGPIHEASDILDRAIQQIRTMSHLLHPPLLDEGGLLSALRWFLDGMTARSGIRTSLDLQPRNFPRLQPEFERNVFRIVQEALTNVFRHSDATEAYVKIIRNDNTLLLMVGDDGKGLDEPTAKLRPTSIGVGIGSMRERARELGGELKMRNGNPGTIVEVVVPNIVAATAYAGVGAV